MLGKIKKLLPKKKAENSNKMAKAEQIRNALAFVFVVACSYGFYWFSSHEGSPVRTNEPPVFDGAFDSAFSRVSDEALIEKQQHQIDDLKAMITKNESPAAKKASEPSEETKALIEAMRQKLDKLETENKEMNGKLQVALLAGSKTNLASIAARPPTREEMEARRLQRVQEEKERYSKAGLETVRFNYRRKNFRKERTRENYVWAGTFVEGVLLTGILGDAGINGSKNMGTALIRLTSGGIMPNNQHSHLNDCTALVSTYGDLSGSSTVLHLETLSCAGRNINFEQKVYGSVFDLDAMQDLRGTSILQTKPLLSYSAAAGMLAGIGDGLKNLNTAQTINPGAGTITTYGQASALAQSAAGGALTNPANRISDYVMRIADIYHPLVVVRAGRRVSVLFTKGFWIDKEHQVYESGKAIDDIDAKNESHVTTTVSRASGTSNYSAGNEVGSNALPVADSVPDDNVAQQFLNQNGLSNEPLFSHVKVPGEPNHG